MKLTDHLVRVEVEGQHGTRAVLMSLIDEPKVQKPNGPPRLLSIIAHAYNRHKLNIPDNLKFSVQSAVTLIVEHAIQEKPFLSESKYLFLSMNTSVNNLAIFLCAATKEEADDPGFSPTSKRPGFFAIYDVEKV